jgi:hypothetical protein
LLPSCNAACPMHAGTPGEGRQKATIEHVFGRLGGDQADGGGGQQPWDFGWQMSERNLVWSDQLKLRLVKVGMHLLPLR